MKKKVKTYKIIVTARIRGKTAIPFCILCDTTNDITWQGAWIDKTRARIICYSLCNECSERFFNSPQADQESIVSKVIERRLDSMLTLPLPTIDEIGTLGARLDYLREVLEELVKQIRR